MKTVLVTGGCGLIGQHLCSGLLKKKFNVMIITVKVAILWKKEHVNIVRKDTMKEKVNA